MSAHSNVMLVNEAETSYIPKESLFEKSTGVYTTARTIDQTFILEYDAHVTRLADSAKTLLASPERAAKVTDGVLATLTTPTLLEPHVYRALHAACQAYAQHHPEDKDERRLTVVLEWDSPRSERGFDLTTYTEHLPPPPPSPVEVKIARCPPSRHGKVAKDAQWTRDRKQLEDQRGTANEVVMVDDNGDLLEGTQSNVYIVDDNVLYTPHREDILEGTVRRVVARVAHTAGLPLKPVAAIPLARIRHWQGMFLTSTSRLVLPVRRCTLLSSLAAIDGHTEFEMPLHPLILELARAVRADLKTGSKDVAAAPTQ